MVVWVDMKLDMSEQYALGAKRVSCVLNASSTVLSAGPGKLVQCLALQCIGLQATPGVLCAVLGARVLETHKIIGEHQEDGD